MHILDAMTPKMPAFFKKSAIVKMRNGQKRSRDSSTLIARLTDVAVDKPFSNDAPIPHNEIDALKQIPLGNPESKT